MPTTFTRITQQPAQIVVVVDQTVNPFLVLFHEPAGYRAEQIRGLRNRLLAMNPDGEPKTLVVTSRDCLIQRWRPWSNIAGRVTSGNYRT